MFSVLLKILGFSLLGGIVFTVIKSVFRKPSNYFIEVTQNFLGSLFIFSGFVKAIDPLGTSYKMKDYFDAFSSFTGISFEFFASMSTFLAVFMIVLELVLGVALILGWKKKFTLGTSALMMIFFTILTGFTYLTGFINPDFYDIATRQELKAAGEQVQVFTKFDHRQMKVTDCGCFGDFLKLSPKVSFMKDILLMFVLLALALGHKHIKPFLGNAFGWMKVVGVGLFTLFFCFANYIWGLPMFDFRPYKIGNNIPEQMIAEREAIIEFNFLYKNKTTGETKEVATTDLKTLNKDEWEYVDRVDNVIDEGIPAKISNFTASDEEGNEMTDQVIHNPEYSFWVLSKSLDKSDKDTWEDLNEINALAVEKGYDMFAFMTSTFEEADEFRHDHQAAYPFYQADETFIKTVVRANPGLILLKNGVVMGKWHHNHIPSKKKMEDYLANLK